ncbi:hypothetical protein C6Q28_01970 [Burkholderia multivorans]|nr:hypothetical protein C6Q28_01970 [Burkholderia multivorans]
MRIHQTVDCARIPAAPASTKKDPARTSGPGPVGLRAFDAFGAPGQASLCCAWKSSYASTMRATSG